MAIKIALAGNPNCGKTTLFNALTGSNQFVGNWPGVTVEKKEGKLKGYQDVVVTDLPGIYSLSPYTPEEVVARNYLLGEHPDVILNLVDGTNLERNLYLTTQLMELGIPMIVAVNMMDIVEKSGSRIWTDELSQKLGCDVVEISALRGTGVGEAAEWAVRLARQGTTAVCACAFGEAVERAVHQVEQKLGDGILQERKRFFAVKLLEKDSQIAGWLEALPDVSGETGALEEAFDDDAESIIANERYEYISSVVQVCYRKPDCENVQGGGSETLTVSDRIDRFVTNRWLALPIFAAVMFLVYYVSVTTVGSWATDWVNDGVFGEGFRLAGLVEVPGIPVLVEGALSAIGCAEWLQGLILDGIVAGVGAVLGFVPQMLVLFLFLAFLESCGYMARVAFIMDRVFRRFGLSGKSFIPMLIGTGCGVPGIMASRTIESDRDRKMTIITTTFIPCGAKLPIIALIAGALFDGAWWVSPSAYFAGICAIVCSGILLKKTNMFAGDPAPFVMELPAYHMPVAGNVLRSMWERGWSFIRKAGTVILVSTVIIWFATYFGWVDGQFRMLDALEIDHSILAFIGNLFGWIFIPLGFGDWRSSVAVITGLVAKENVVGTFGILFGFAEVAEDGGEYWRVLAGSMSAASAYSFLVFNLLCAPCFAAMGAIKREMNNIRWFWFAIGYQCLLAYVVALCIYQISMLITTGIFGVGTAAAFVLMGGFAYLLLRPVQEKRYPHLRIHRNVLAK
ncbi:MAG: ferrous iron transport protein B [Lachnospiraceae bacterium]|jgi:ferrous iron transport protein B|nr:ferrous iron transport protein B [Lachnospiraceae bacterium]